MQNKYKKWAKNEIKKEIQRHIVFVDTNRKKYPQHLAFFARCSWETPCFFFHLSLEF